MKISIAGLHLLSTSSLQALEADAVAAGHTIVSDDVQTLVNAAEEKFPALVTAFKSAFDEVEKDTTVSGVAKMGKAVELVVPQIPEIAAELADLPNLTSFLVELGQSIWTRTLTDLESAAEKIVKDIL